MVHPFIGFGIGLTHIWGHANINVVNIYYIENVFIMLSRGQKDPTRANCNWPCLVWTNLFIIFLQKMHLVLAHCTALLDDLWVFLLECQEGDESCRLKCNFISSNHLQINIIHWIKWYKWTIQSSNTLLVLVKNQLTEIQKSHETELLNITCSPNMCHIFMQKLSWIAFVDLIFRSFFAELPKCYCTRKKLN